MITVYSFCLVHVYIYIYMYVLYIYIYILILHHEIAIDPGIGTTSIQQLPLWPGLLYSALDPSQNEKKLDRDWLKGQEGKLSVIVDLYIYNI